jgi:hypothetical protein
MNVVMIELLGVSTTEREEHPSREAARDRLEDLRKYYQLKGYVVLQDGTNGYSFGESGVTFGRFYHCEEQEP